VKLHPIKRRHLLYALKRSIDPLVTGVVFLVVASFVYDAPLLHFLQAFIPFILLGLGYFGYYLWKVIKDR
jgi:uncharacterized RDD family membrane protein YckC